MVSRKKILLLKGDLRVDEHSLSRAKASGVRLSLCAGPALPSNTYHNAGRGNQNGSVTFTGYRQLECSLTPALRMKASAHERQALTNLLTHTKKKKRKKPRTHQKTHCGLR